MARPFSIHTNKYNRTLRNFMQESIAESFSFEDSRKHKQMMVRNTAME